MSEIEQNLLKYKLQKVSNVYNEIVDLQLNYPKLFEEVKKCAGKEKAYYSVWLSQQGFFNVVSSKGQLTSEQIKDRILPFADNDKIIEDLKIKDSKIVDIILTRAKFLKMNYVDYVKHISDLTWYRRGVNDNDVINIRLKNYAEDGKYIISDDFTSSKCWLQIKWQARKEKITINDWFAQHSNYVYLSRQALSNYKMEELTNEKNRILFNKNPKKYFDNIKARIQNVATEHTIESLSDIRKIDKTLANSIRYLQRFYPEGTLGSWYKLIEKMELTALIPKTNKIIKNNNVKIEIIQQKLEDILAKSYPNKVVTKTSPHLKYLSQKLSAYYHKSVKEIFEEQGYEYPNGVFTIKRLKSVVVVKKTTVVKKGLFRGAKSLPNLLHLETLTKNKK